MAPAESTVAALRLWCANFGGLFPSDVDLGKEISRMRQTLGRASPSDAAELSLQFAVGSEPLTKSLRSGSRQYKSADLLGDAVYEGFKVVAAKTKLIKMYGTVVDSEQYWNTVVGYLWRSYHGDTLAPPTRVPGRVGRPILPVSSSPSQLAPTPVPWRQRIGSFMTQNWILSFFFALLSMVPVGLRDYMSTGRERLQLLVLSAVLVCFTVLYFYKGPDRLWVPPSPQVLLQDQQDDDDVDDTATEVYSESMAEAASAQSSPSKAPAESEAIRLLREELEDLRAQVAASPAKGSLPPGIPASLSPEAPEFHPAQPAPDNSQVQALHEFAFNATPSGRISQTAARMEAQNGAFPMAPRLPPPAGAGVGDVSDPRLSWQPHESVTRTQDQAKIILDALNLWEGQKATNPYWARYFWEEVSSVEARNSSQTSSAFCSVMATWAGAPWPRLRLLFART